jgi:hypothetical protein
VWHWCTVDPRRAEPSPSFCGASRSENPRSYLDDGLHHTQSQVSRARHPVRHGDAIVATKSLNDDVLADYIRKTKFTTVVWDVKFGKKGEWQEERTLAAQFRFDFGLSNRLPAEHQ